MITSDRSTLLRLWRDNTRTNSISFYAVPITKNIEKTYTVLLMRVEYLSPFSWQILPPHQTRMGWIRYFFILLKPQIWLFNQKIVWRMCMSLLQKTILKKVEYYHNEFIHSTFKNPTKINNINFINMRIFTDQRNSSIKPKTVLICTLPFSSSLRFLERRSKCSTHALFYFKRV